MKLAMILIILGGLLLIGSGCRIADELYTGDLVEVLDGLLVSIAIGGLLLYKGLRRYSKIKRLLLGKDVEGGKRNVTNNRGT